MRPGRVRSDSGRFAHRFDDWSDEASNMKTETETRRECRREIPLGLAAPDHTVPYGTVLSRDAFPGTSCQATIGVVPTGRACRHFATASLQELGILVCTRILQWSGSGKPRPTLVWCL